MHSYKTFENGLYNKISSFYDKFTFYTRNDTIQQTGVGPLLLQMSILFSKSNDT
jgi:hypothetical protein